MPFLRTIIFSSYFNLHLVFHLKFATKKVPTFQSRPLYHSSAISFRLPPASISAAASLRLTLVFHLRFRLSLGRPFHDSSPLPFHFLTPAVSAFFRPPQFWILTTQPLLFLSFSSRFRLTGAFPVPVSALASSVSPFSPA